MKKFILIGYGSIGKFHLSKINQSEVYIVDPKLNSEYLIPNELKTNKIGRAHV